MAEQALQLQLYEIKAMKLIYRYVVREFVESFLFGLVVFSSILLLDQVFQLVDLLLSKGIAFLVVVNLFLLILPNIFSLTIPMAVLFGILLSYGRLSEDNEITAMRATGIHYKHFTVPVLIVVASLSVFLVYFNQELSPSTHRHFRSLYQDVLTRRPLIKFEEKTITELGDYRLYVQKVNTKSNSLHGVNIYRFQPGEEGIPWRISASSAIVSVTPQAVVFDMFRGYWQQPNPSKLNTLIHLNFTRYRFSVPIGSQIMPFSQSLREMTSRELNAEIKKYRQKKMPANFLQNEYWLRWTLALAPLVFGLIGVPLGIITERGGKSIGFGVSLLVLFCYYLLLVTALNMGEKGYAPPGLILWLPNIIGSVTSVWLWRRMLKK